MAVNQMESDVLDRRIINNADRLSIAEWKKVIGVFPAERVIELKQEVEDLYFMNEAERQAWSGALQSSVTGKGGQAYDDKYRRLVANVGLFPVKAIGRLWVALGGPQDYE